MATDCPGCSLPMAHLGLEGHYGRTVALDCCHACGGFWFDGHESLALTPGAILRLLMVIGEQKTDRRPPVGSLRCPRCRRSLVPTSDMQRDVRFSYQRCPADHGRFITFAEFLREKNFVRPLRGDELARLRASVKMIHCSSCGAPIDLERTSTCGYCRAPVSILDGAQVDRVVRELKQAETERRTVDPALPLRLMADRLHVERLFRELDRSPGLVEAGLATVAELLTAAD